MTKKFVVIKAFTDLVDNKHEYAVGDDYPRGNVKVDDARVKSLATKKNAGNKVYIKSHGVPEVFPVHSGGGYYELSNGNKVQGKKDAKRAEQALMGGE